MSARRVIAWVSVLAATHLGAFLVASHGREAPGGAEGQVAGDSAQRGKSAPRQNRASADYAQLWKELHETPMSRAEFERTRDRLLLAWMKRDLGAVMDLLLGPDASEQVSKVFNNVELRQALSEEIKRNSQRVLEWIQDGRFGSHRNEVFNWWGSAYGQVEGIIAILPECTPYERSSTLRSMAEHGDEKALGQVRKALGSWFREGRRREQVVEAYAKRKADLAAGDLTVLFAQETDPQVRQFLGQGWMKARLGNTPDIKRFGEVLELPDDARGEAVATLMKSFAGDGIKGMAPALAEFGRLGMWSELATEHTRDAVSSCALKERQERKGGTETFTTIMAIPDPATRALLMQGVGQGMVNSTNTSLDVYERAVEMLPAGPELDGYLAGMVRSYVDLNNPESARIGIGKIGSPELRAQMTKELEAK